MESNFLSFSIYPEADVVPYAFSLDRTNALELINQ